MIILGIRFEFIYAGSYLDVKDSQAEQAYQQVKYHIEAK